MVRTTLVARNNYNQSKEQFRRATREGQTLKDQEQALKISKAESGTGT